MTLLISPHAKNFCIKSCSLHTGDTPLTTLQLSKCREAGVDVGYRKKQ